jgi:hypothetical protein
VYTLTITAETAQELGAQLGALVGAPPAPTQTTNAPATPQAASVPEVAPASTPCEEAAIAAITPAGVQRKRGRPRKHVQETMATPTPAPAPVQSVERNKVENAVRQMVASKGVEAVRKLLSEYEANRVSDLVDDKLPAFFAAVNAALENG